MSVTTAVGLDFMVNSITGQADLQRVIQQATGRGAAHGLGGAIEDTQKQIEAKYGRAYTNALKVGAKQEADQMEQHFRERQKKIESEVALLMKANQKVEEYKDRADSNRTKKRWKARKKELEESIRMEQRAQEKLLREREEAQEHMVELFDRGMQQAADKLESRTEKIGKGFGDTIESIFSSGGSFDPSQMLKSAGAGFKDMAPGMVTTGSKLAAKGGMMGGIGKSLMFLGSKAGPIAGIVGAVAGLAAVMKMAYSQTKDMNKAIMEGAGGFDMVGTEGAHLAKRMTEVRKATHRVALRYRQSTEEIQGYLSAMQEAGLTYREMGRYADFASDDLMAFTSVARQALVAAKQFGVGANDIAEFTNSLYRDMGQNYLGVDEALQGIFGSAQLANMSMRQFFTSINEATSSMALMNFRMEDTAELLIAMTDILGEDMGKEMAGFKGRFRDMSHTDRMRSVMTGGGAGRQVLSAASDRQTANFLSSLETGIGGLSTKRILETQGLLKDGQLDLSGLSGAKLGMVQEMIAQSGDESHAIRLGKLARLQRGTTADASLGQRATALGQVGDLGELAFGFVEATAALGDKNLGEMEGLDRAAFENITGRSGAELEAMMDVSNRMAARIATEKGVGIESITATDIATAIASGDMHLSAADREALKEASEAAMPEMEKLTRQQLVETTSIGQTLKNKIGGLLEQTYSLISFWAGDTTSSEVEVMKAAQSALDAAREASANAETAYSDFDPATYGSDLAKKLKESPEFSGEEFIAMGDKMMDEGVGADGPITSAMVMDRLVAEKMDQIPDLVAAEQRRLAQAKVSAERVLEQKEAGYGAALGVGLQTSVNQAEAEAAGQWTESHTGEESMGARAIKRGNKNIERANSPKWYEHPGVLRAVGETEVALGEEMVVEDIAEAEKIAAEKVVEAGKKDADGIENAVEGSSNKIIRAIHEGNRGNILGELAVATGTGTTALMKMNKGQLLHAVKGKTLTNEQKVALQTRIGQLERGVDDFIYRGGSSGGIITPINRQDEFLGMKPGGAIAQAMGSGAVVNNFYINGNNTNQIVSVVKRAVTAALRK